MQERQRDQTKQNHINVLALEASGEACSVALKFKDKIIERHEVAPKRHTELMLPMVDAVLAEAGVALTELDAIAFANGPGSFTGVRIAASVAQGLALGANLPIITVSSLHGLAEVAREKFKCEKILVALDARIGEIYVGAYRMPENDISVEFQREGAVSSSIFPDGLYVPWRIPEIVGDNWCGIGNAWLKYGDVIPDYLAARVNCVTEEIHPHASAIARIACYEFAAGRRGCVAEAALPIYLASQA
jgi:tRNA threonylcarbamoyladenosine biosynthesis protein TsaB